MLPVTDLIEIALGRSELGDLSARAPRRFEAVTRNSPVVIWNICMHCSMHCPHCYAAAVAEPSPTDLTHEEGIDLLDQLADAGVRVVIFSGGEPLLRTDAFELIAHANRRGISPQLSTNGVLIDEARRETPGRSRRWPTWASASMASKPSTTPTAALQGGFEAALARPAQRQGRGNEDRAAHDALEAQSSISSNRWSMSRGMRTSTASTYRTSSTRGAGTRWRTKTCPGSSSAAPWAGSSRRPSSLIEIDPTVKIVTGSNDSDGVFLLRWMARPLRAMRRARRSARTAAAARR